MRNAARVWLGLDPPHCQGVNVQRGGDSRGPCCATSELGLCGEAKTPHPTCIVIDCSCQSGAHHLFICDTQSPCTNMATGGWGGVRV
jgi:hypothetical protein